MVASLVVASLVPASLVPASLVPASLVVASLVVASLVVVPASLVVGSLVVRVPTSAAPGTRSATATISDARVRPPPIQSGQGTERWGGGAMIGSGTTVSSPRAGRVPPSADSGGPTTTGTVGSWSRTARSSWARSAAVAGRSSGLWAQARCSTGRRGSGTSSQRGDVGRARNRSTGVAAVTRL